jgi:signal peptidase I
VSGAAQPPDPSAQGAAENGELDGTGRAPARRGLRRYRPVLNIAAVAALVLFLLYVHTHLLRVAYIPTASMAPTLQPGDRVLVSLAAYRRHPPRRGDIVAFWDPTSGEHQVKRVIAIGGDNIDIYWGVVFLNGDVLAEPYLVEPMLAETPLSRHVAQGELFVMGDNRNASEDSRDNGTIPGDSVLGRIFFRILPLRSLGPVG